MQVRRHSQFRDINASDASKTIAIPRHRWYYYKEGFSPDLVELAIERLRLNSDSLIIDPFNGSGTVTLQSAIHGIESVGIEVNPFTSFISKTKTSSVNKKEVLEKMDDVIHHACLGGASPLLYYSTFSEKGENDKWLFNSAVLNAYEGANSALINCHSAIKDIFRIALIGAAMDNCNCRRDGKCLRYKVNWRELNYNASSFIESFKRRLAIIVDDLESTPVLGDAHIICADSREFLANYHERMFDLCITSPPYLNTFDYTDIYRPELFLGGFVSNNKDLYNLRLKTIRSHVQAKWASPIVQDFGELYSKCLGQVINKSDRLMHNRIPMMIQAYFEDMYQVLSQLKLCANKNAEIWLVVSTSAYADVEIPVDFIIGEIGQRLGWSLLEINVMRVIKKRKTIYSPSIATLRESLVILRNG